MEEEISTSLPDVPENKFDRNSFAMQLFILSALFLGFFILSQLIAAGILLAAYGMEVMDMHKLADKNADLNPIRFAQMLATIIGFGVPGLVFSKLKTRSWLQFSGIQNKFPALLILLVPFIVITAYPLINVSFFINKQAFFADWMKSAQEEYEFLTTALMGGTSYSILFINLFTIAIFPAIAEEWFFRGTMQPLFQKKMNAHAAICITAIIFSLIHFDFSGFLPRICLGVLLGYIYYFSGSLWVSIWAHLFNNGMEVILRFLKNTGRISMGIDKPSMPAVWELLLYTALFGALVYAFYYIGRKKFDTFA